MSRAAAAPRRGFTLFEFAVVCAVFGALVGALLLRVQFYQAEAERAAVNQVVATLRVALQWRIADHARAPRGTSLEALARENPMDWLLEKPANYLGEYYSPPVEDLPRGNWVFDRRDRLLIYLPNTVKSFSFGASNLLKFKVEFVQAPGQGAMKNGAAESRPALALVQLSD